MGPINPSLSLPAPLSLGIPASSAHLLSFLSTTSYVGSLYLAQTLLLPRKKGTSTPPSRSSPTTSGVQTPNGLVPIASTDDKDIASNLNFAANPHAPKPGDRDHPATIRARLKAVSAATALALGGVWWVIKSEGGYSPVAAVCNSRQILS
jgi:prenyl protein peptidase